MAVDIRNPGNAPDDRLAPSGATGGLICRYGVHDVNGRFDPQSEMAMVGQLYSSVALSGHEAGALSLVLSRVALSRPSVLTAACPVEWPGTATIIVLAYAQQPDLDLWFLDSGCRTLDNGQVGAWELGNPSFYNGFEQAFQMAASTGQAVGIGGGSS